LQELEVFARIEREISQACALSLLHKGRQAGQGERRKERKEGGLWVGGAFGQCRTPGENEHQSTA
jgi:hypothetical protein